MENKEMENKEITLFNNKKTVNVYCSKKTENEDENKELFNALENCDYLLNDCVGEEIEMKDIYVEERRVIDEETGEIKFKYRTIIFDSRGITYVTTSYGIYNILGKIVQVYGFPTEWKKPLKVKVLKRSIDNERQILTLMIV